MSETLHDFILKKLKQPLVQSYGDDVAQLSDSEILRLLFVNYRLREGVHHGLRLSGIGARLMKKQYDSYRYDMNIKPNHKAYTVLDRNANWPYYIGRKYITYFAEEDAAWYRLNGSNVNTYIEYI